jgi:methionine-rich copper-binding protein CopC
VGAIVAGLLLLLLPAAPALAHAQLISMTPAAGSTVSVAPNRVLLRFGEVMQSMGSSVVVLDPAGGQVQTDEMLVKGRTIIVGLEALTIPGTYSVNYRVLSSDGHVVTDTRSFVFAPAPGASAPASAQAAAPEADADAPTSNAGWSVYAIGGLLLACVLIVIVALRRRT